MIIKTLTKWGNNSIMKFKKYVLCGLITFSTCPVASYAAGMFGNPAEIGKSGQIEIQFGGGNISEFGLDIDKTTGTTQISNLTINQSVPAMTGKLKEDQVFIGMSYTTNSHSQLFANLGTGKDTGQKTSSYAIGFKISPETESSTVKVGLMVRAQQVKTDIDGRYSISPPYNGINDGVNINSFAGPINGTEQITYMRYDMFFGASRNSGVFRPYGGLGFTHIAGTYSLALDDTVPVYALPVGGGAITTTTQHVAFNAKSNISGSRYFTAVLGLSLNLDNEFGMTAELQSGVQTVFMLSGSVKF
jgi:hypothetical protein